MFNQPSLQQPKQSTWLAPPRIQNLKSKSKKQKKQSLFIEPIFEPKVVEEEKLPIETSQISEIMQLEEDKHNTSKQSMQKYLL
jgi:ABC-type Zn2+ transport system substrate-binding protein/surface adhesin